MITWLDRELVYIDHVCMSLKYYEIKLSFISLGTKRFEN